MKRFSAWLAIYFVLVMAAMPAMATSNIREETNYSKPVTVNVDGPSNTKTALAVKGGALKVGTGTPGTTPGQNDVYVTGTLEVDGAVDLAASTLKLRGVTYTMPAADGTASQYLQTNGSATLSWAAGTSGTMDEAYNNGSTITVDSGAVQLNGSHASNDTFFINKTAGTGDAMQITNAGTGYDINGTSGTWYITKAGVATFASLAGLTSGITVNGGVINLNASSNFATNINTGTSTATVTIGSGVNSVGIDSSSWDISTSGAISGVTTIGMSGDLTLSAGDVLLANGKAVKSSTTTGQTMKLQGYDNDNNTYRDVVTITNGNTVALAVGSNNETLAIDTADWDISATGAMTGIGAITMDGILTINNAAVTLYANEAITITHAANGAADDLIFAQTGAQDASILLQSAGTGADAIGLQASAGGVDIDAAAAQDVNIAGGQVALVSKDDAASAISLTANIGVSETIVVTNTLGTSESAITLLSTAGGVNVDAAAAKDVDIAGGQVKLVSKDDTASAISLTANIGTSETIVVTNTQGTAEGAIALTSTAGGVDINAAATKNVAIDGGQVLIGSLDNVASAIALTTNVGTSETILITNTQGTDAAAINLTATAGGITTAVAAGKAITLNGTTNFKVGSNIASPAGGELDLGDGTYFYITGTNNITSIAAADSTAGRLVILRFADVLTFTDGNNLKLAGNFATSADDTITLMCDGTNWYETGRSAN